MKKLKVLWFEVTPPSRYGMANKKFIGGWQDSLETIVRSCDEIDLSICFPGIGGMMQKSVDGVTYIPLVIDYSKKEEKTKNRDYHVAAAKLVPLMMSIVNDCRPDVIHVFGTEYAYGLIAEHTSVPVVVHIQGSYIPYNNAFYPPNYNLLDKVIQIGFMHPRRIRNAIIYQRYLHSIEQVEREVWRAAENYMGRTGWDYALSDVMHPGRRYFHVEEALRQPFIKGCYEWDPIRDGKVRLITTGCGTFWKGPDMMLKTAKVLTELGFDFEWTIVGQMYDEIQQIVEKKEKSRFVDNHVKLVGRLDPEELSYKLCKSTLYVHTAYIENSPNAICEAQCIGLPVVSTNVGGVSSLVRHNVDGVLVAANDPWQMAYAIKELADNVEKQTIYSKNTREYALRRHNPDHILAELLSCYKELLSK